METFSLISIISIALLGSFGHCIGMCGGIVVAYSSTKIKSEYSKTIQSVAHLLYSFGRVTTYTILGAIFGFIGGVVTFFKYYKWSFFINNWFFDGNSWIFTFRKNKIFNYFGA